MIFDGNRQNTGTGMQPRKIILENGAEYCGFSFGAVKDAVLEIVFNTSMVGYQEILSDPSYTDQAVVMTYPLIGNYGMAAEDYECEAPSIGALIVREYNDEPSSFRSRETLDAVMKRYGIAGICGIDTRALARRIRDYGSCKALITGPDTSMQEGLRRMAPCPLPRDAVSRVSCRIQKTYPATPPRFRVAAIDCGMKQGITRCLNERGCSVITVPWNTPAEKILALEPDGLFISNGPGDPTDIGQTIQAIRSLKGAFPIFGICLGHQLIALAYGAATYKLKFGHRGGNHPVRDLRTGKISVTSQNHSYAVDAASLSGTPLEVTHINLLDGTVEGIACEKDKVFSVQYHPESAPGPLDSAGLFDHFIHLMEEHKDHA